MILAGDIGGTKTVLALYARGGDIRHPTKETRFASGDYASLEAIIGEFLADSPTHPSAAAFGVAGPVMGHRAEVTNLPWVIDADTISETFSIPVVHLLNDLRAVATAVPHLGPQDFAALNEHDPQPPGTIAVIAPGTGLGMAYLNWVDGEYRALPTEGGHQSFAPTTPVQADLLAFLTQRFGHVSFERVCCGIGVPNLYDFLLSTGRYSEPEWLRDALAATDDATPVIMNAGQAGKADICVAALDLFVQILGTVVGNAAVQFLPTGGIYLGGGIAPRILDRLRQPDFLQAMCDKGRFSELVACYPVRVMLDPKAALHGAAWDGFRAAGV